MNGSELCNKQRMAQSSATSPCMAQSYRLCSTANSAAKKAQTLSPVLRTATSDKSCSCQTYILHCSVAECTSSSILRAFSQKGFSVIIHSVFSYIHHLLSTQFSWQLWIMMSSNVCVYTCCHQSQNVSTELKLSDLHRIIMTLVITISVSQNLSSEIKVFVIRRIITASMMNDSVSRVNRLCQSVKIYPVKSKCFTATEWSQHQWWMTM